MTLPLRATGEPLDTDEIRRLVGGMVDEAERYIEDTLAKDRQKATDYYWGRPFGNEEEGRSQVVTTDVRDTVNGILPSLLRIFRGSEKAVEFHAREPEDEEAAAQATDTINYLVERNRGFSIFHAWFKDALIRRTGFVKWWWDDSEEVTETKYQGLTFEQILVLLDEEGVEVNDQERFDPVAPATEPTYNATVKRTRQSGMLRLAAVPPEEILWNRNARNLHDALIVVHKTEKRLDELVAMGFDRDEILEHAGHASNRIEEQEAQARRFDQDFHTDSELQDPATRPIRYDEAYVRLDKSGDGVSQLYKVGLVGNAHHLLFCDPVSHVPIAMLCPDPEPHTVVGQSVADLTMDLQKINSAVLRGTLDSLGLALHQRTIVNEDLVNVKDVLNTEVGGVIRARGDVNAAMREVRHTFVGDTTLPMLEYLKDVKEDRTGQSKASQGLDADVLQSTTKAAVTATLSKAQERVEMWARVFAETGITDLYTGLLTTLIEHQDRPMVVRLRNRYIEVDPRTWHTGMDVVVNVALGAGMPEDRLALLREIAADQTNIMMQLGPGNPLVSLKQIRHTRARIAELAGFVNPAAFYKEISDEDEQQAAQAAQQQPPPDPNALLAQAEMAKVEAQAKKTEAEFALKQQELALKERMLTLEDDRERDQQAANIAMRLKEMELKYQASINRAEIDAQIKRERAALDADVRRQQAEAVAASRIEAAKIAAAAAATPRTVSIDRKK